MNTGQHNTFSTEATQKSGGTTKKQRTIDDTTTPTFNIKFKDDDKKRVTGPPLMKLSKQNQLPLLDKKMGASRARMLTPPAANELTEENTTTHMITHSRATHKALLTDHVSKKNSKIPGKSFPRLIGGLRKLEKMPKGKIVDPIAEGEKVLKQAKEVPKPTSKQADDKTPKSNVFIKCHSKVVAGYSEGKTKTNQDTVYLYGLVKDSKNCSLFGAFDGHGVQGHKVSQYLKSQLTGI